MVRVKPQETRSRISEVSGGLQIVIPAKRNIFIILFLAAWLVGWAAGEVMVPTSFFKKNMPLGGQIFTIAWLVGWTVGGLFAIYIWLWTLVGKEVVLIDGITLAIRRDILGYGRFKEYELSHLRNLRASPASFNMWNFSGALQFWGLGGGIIAFDYGARTYRFGASIDEAEGDHIIQHITQRYDIRSGQM